MANGDGFDFQGLLANPLFNVGTGLLAAGLGNPTSFGEGLGQGLRFGNQQQNLATRNELLRNRVRMLGEERTARERRDNAIRILQTGLDDPEDEESLDRGQILGLLADVSPQAFAQGLLTQALPKPVQPTGFQRDFEFLRSLGRSEEEALAALKKGTTVNVGLDKALSVNDLTKVRRRDGTKFPIGTTGRQAAAEGGQVLTTDQVKALNAADKFSGVLDKLEDLALGPGGVFLNIEPGLKNRVSAGFDLFISSLDRENPNVADFDSLATGTVAPIIRQLGDSGALSDGDVARALGLLPQIRGEFLLPDTREDARRKLETLRNILERGEKKLRGQLKSGPRRSLTPSPRSERTAPGRVVDFNDLPG